MSLVELERDTRAAAVIALLLFRELRSKEYAPLPRFPWLASVGDDTASHATFRCVSWVALQ